MVGLIGLRPKIPRVGSGRAGHFFGPYGPRAGRADGLWPDPPLTAIFCVIWSKSRDILTENPKNFLTG